MCHMREPREIESARQRTSARGRLHRSAAKLRCAQVMRLVTRSFFPPTETLRIKFDGYNQVCDVLGLFRAAKYTFVHITSWYLLSGYNLRKKGGLQ